MNLKLALVFISALICVEIDADEMGAAVMPKDSVAPAWETGNASDRHRLRHDMFTDEHYDAKVYPDDLHVALGGHLLSFFLDETSFSTFEANIWLRLKWRDSRLTWNPSDYGGVNVMHIPIDDIWKPDVTLYNSGNPSEMMSCFESQAIVYSNGDVLWVPPCRVTAQCPLKLDIAPYGEQTCTLKFGSWTLDSKLIDINFFDGEHQFNTQELTRGLEWEIVSQSAQKNVKEYPCCPGMKWPDLEFNFTVRRVPEGPARHAHD